MALTITLLLGSPESNVGVCTTEFGTALGPLSKTPTNSTTSIGKEVVVHP